MISKFVLVLLLSLGFSGSVNAQSPCPVTQSNPGFTAGGNVFGRVAAQWKAYFGAKVDANNGTLCYPTIYPPIDSGMLSVVENNAVLKSVVGAAGRKVLRTGFTTSDDGGAALYAWSASNCSAADDGSQVQPNVTGCWIADFSVIQANVRQFGAKGDCVTNDSAAFGAALSLGIPIHATAGHYLLSTQNTYNTRIVLTGDGYEETGLAIGNHCDLTMRGTYIVHTNAAISPFIMNAHPTRGSTFDNFAVVQLHATPGAGWAPTAYSPVWTLINTQGATNFRNIGLGGVYAAIDAVSNTARVSMRNISGQVFSYLFRSDAALDISRAQDIHIWPFWSADLNVIGWQFENSDLFYFRRQDGFQADNIFVLGARSCIRSGVWNPGSAAGIQFGNLTCDVVKHSIHVDSDSINSAISISHLWHSSGQFSGVPIPGSSAIKIDGGNATIRIGDINVLMTEGSVIKNTNINLGSQVHIGSIAAGAFPTQGWNWSGGVSFAGTAPVIDDASPANGSSTYSIANSIWPQNAGENVDSGLSSGVINANSYAQLFMANQDQTWRLQAVVNNETYVWPNWASTLYLNGAVANVILKLPKSMLDGQTITLSCDDTITNLSVVPDDGSLFTLINAPTTCAAGESFRFKASLAGTPLYRTLK